MNTNNHESNAGSHLEKPRSGALCISSPGGGESQAEANPGTVKVNASVSSTASFSGEVRPFAFHLASTAQSRAEDAPFRREPFVFGRAHSWLKNRSFA